MFTINLKQVVASIFSILLIGCIFSNWAFGQQGKIAPGVLRAAIAQKNVRVIVRLQDQPAREIAEVVHAQFIPQIDAIAREIRNKTLPFDQQGQPLPLALRQEVQALRAELDRGTQQMSQEIHTQISNRISGGQQRVRAAIERAGGTVHVQIATTNALGAELPAGTINQIALLPEVREIELDSEGRQALSISVQTIKASQFWNFGYNGSGIDVGIVDRGVDLTHVALQSHSGIPARGAPDLDEIAHGTKVAGVVASTDAQYKGVAWGLQYILDATATGGRNAEASQQEITASESLYGESFRRTLEK